MGLRKSESAREREREREEERRKKKEKVKRERKGSFTSFRVLFSLSVGSFLSFSFFKREREREREREVRKSGISRTHASMTGGGSKLDQVIVHPLVLLSVVDNYNRVAQNTRKRVVGVLLGENEKGVVHVTNSYAVPLEEDEKDGGIWFMDYSYHENMYAMFRKINAREVVVGWYSTGPSLRVADLEINQLMTKYCKQPLLVIVDA